MIREAALREQYELIIDGEAVSSVTGQYFDVLNPANEQFIARVPKANLLDVDKAVAAAKKALKGKWGSWPASRRAKTLSKIAALMRERLDELVELEILNTGKVAAFARGEVLRSIEDLEVYAGAITSLAGSTKQVPNGFFHYSVKEPVGVCAQIIPWNYPLMMACWKIGPALAAGCTIVLKPASLTPLTALLLGEICHEAGLPPGVLNVVTGSGSEIGSYLVEHPDVNKVAFTGETVTGKDIMARASGTLKRVTLELGGKSPNLIFSDADLDAAVKGSLFGIFHNAGQSCEARSRLLIHEDVYDQFMSSFVSGAKQIRVGDPFDKNSQVGSMISKSQLDKVHAYVESAKAEGATVLCGGNFPQEAEFARGYWYPPTVLADVTPSMRVFKEEIFGPVVVVTKFKEEAEAIRLANDSVYGLAASLWTNDLSRAHRVAAQLEAGAIMVNSPFSGFPGLPFGGYKQSGFGRELAIESLDLYLETKSVLTYVGSKRLNPLGI